jgi:hypothetical protein
MNGRVQQDPALERLLGLEGACYGKRQHLSWPKPSHVEKDEFLEPFHGGEPFPPVGIAGVHARLVEPRVLRVEASPKDRWLLRTEPGLESRVRLARETPWRVDLEGEGQGALSLVLESGQGVLVEFGARGLSWTPVEIAPWAADENPSAPDVAAWARAEGDAWLADVLSCWLSAGTLWDKCVALGLYVRLREEPRDHVKVAVARLLRGQADPRDAEAFRWARMLRHDHVMAIDDALSEALGQLERDLAASFAAPQPDRPEWRTGLAALCRRRDEIEAGLQILGARAPQGPLQDRTQQLDERAEPWVAALPRGSELEDEHLRRVALGDPEAWWARLAAVR